MTRSVQYATYNEAAGALEAGEWTIDPQGAIDTGFTGEPPDRFQRIAFDTDNGPRFGTIIMDANCDMWSLMTEAEAQEFAAERLTEMTK